MAPPDINKSACGMTYGLTREVVMQQNECCALDLPPASPSP